MKSSPLIKRILRLCNLRGFPSPELSTHPTVIGHTVNEQLFWLQRVRHVLAKALESKESYTAEVTRHDWAMIENLINSMLSVQNNCIRGYSQKYVMLPVDELEYDELKAWRKLPENKIFRNYRVRHFSDEAIILIWMSKPMYQAYLTWRDRYTLNPKSDV